MTGPTRITAIWKFDCTYLSIIVGLITGMSAIVTALCGDLRLHVLRKLRINEYFDSISLF